MLFGTMLTNGESMRLPARMQHRFRGRSFTHTCLIHTLKAIQCQCFQTACCVLYKQLRLLKGTSSCVSLRRATTTPDCAQP